MRRLLRKKWQSNAWRIFFKIAQFNFKTQILKEKPITPIVIGHGQHLAVARLTVGFQSDITDPLHPFHSAWASFEEWAKQQELVALWIYAQDSIGGEDWRLLSVAPAI